MRAGVLVFLFANSLFAQTPPATAPCSGAEFKQLDFWVGEWDAEFTNANGTVGKATNTITRSDFGPCVVTEHFQLPGGGATGSDFVGGSFSIFDAQTKTWRQMWVDNQGGMFDLRGGRVEGKPHIFEMVNIEPRGPKQLMMRMIWQDVTADSFTWRWQSQGADGEWTDRWVLRYKRRSAPRG